MRRRNRTLGAREDYGARRWDEVRTSGDLDPICEPEAFVEQAKRDAVGPYLDLAIDLHGPFNLPEVLRICKDVEHLDLLWLEDPICSTILNFLAFEYYSGNFPLWSTMLLMKDPIQ